MVFVTQCFTLLHFNEIILNSLMCSKLDDSSTCFLQNPVVDKDKANISGKSEDDYSSHTEESEDGLSSDGEDLRYEGEDTSEQPPHKKRKKKIDKGQLFKPLSNDELHQLKDAENLFHSSVFKLQVHAHCHVDLRPK